MKSHGVFKFIAIGLCALCLLSACGGLAGIICLSEGDLYNKTVDECLAQRTNDYAEHYAAQVALEYAGKILGGCPSEMLRAQADEMYGSPDWFYRLYPDYGYEILDAEGRVVSSYNLENAKANPSSVCYSYPETGKYMHFVGLAGQTELEEERLPRTVEEGEEYLYDDKALEQYRKTHKGNFTLQRYKGRGEMDAAQLWETTLNPETRILKKVEIEDARIASDITGLLMGPDVPPRKAFIYKHAHDAELDI